MKLASLTRLLLLLILIVAGCRDNAATSPPSTIVPTATTGAEPTPLSADVATPEPPGPPSFITIVTDAPNPPFADFNLVSIDDFGSVIGFDADVMTILADHLDLEYEFVVTSYDRMLDSVADGEFDAAMSALVIGTDTAPGIVYTDPYVEVGQVMVVRANEQTLQRPGDVGPGTRVGAQDHSAGEATAREGLGVSEPDLQLFNTIPETIQALIDGVIDVAIVDHDDAARYTQTYWQQLKLAGGEGRDAWISSRAYGIAVAEDNPTLLEMLNRAIAQTRPTYEAAQNRWLVAQAPIEAGESLIGTPADQLVIGGVAQSLQLDPTAPPDLPGWELAYNTASGLLTLDAENQLAPLLAADLPTIGEDGLTYTFTLREGLTFPDGSSLTAEDVKWSVDRARTASGGTPIVNGVLKDADDNGFADDDAVVVVSPQQVRFVLQEPTSHFLYLLATPPYFVVNQTCYLSDPDPAHNCAGLGPYQLAEWVAGERIELEANPAWPGEPPLFDRVQLRLYPDAASMRNALGLSAIDIAWTGLSEGDLAELRQNAGLAYWVGPTSFKSYLVFEQSQPPWDDERLRQAVAYAVDREALAAVFNGQRQPLNSPVPDTSPGHLSVEPARDLEQARALLALAGYTEENPLAIDIWYISDGRYSVHEEAYATALKEQLEETGVFQVTLQSAPWEVYRGEMSRCNYPAFLLGWPSPGQPPRSADPSAWTHYFITNTSSICSNYESTAMDALLTAALATNPLFEEEFIAAYNQIQLLWATEFPALDLTQAPRIAVSLTNVHDVSQAIDALGLLHYGRLSKGEVER